MAAAAATAGADYGQRPAAAPLSPLAEAQELLLASAGSSTRTLDEAAAMRGRAGSLGVLLQPAPPQQQQPAAAAGVVSPAQSRPRQPSTTTPALALALALSGVQGGGGGGGASSRLSQSLSTTGETILDDSRSERSSASDALSIRYQGGSSFGSKLLSGNFPSLSRGVSSHSAAAAAAASALTAALPKYNRLSVTPVPLGPLLAKGSYRFAKIQFTLPPITDMSPVSSVFLDFDYTVDITMTLGGSFGSTKKASGKLPLKIVTIRTAAKASAPPTEGTLRNSALLSDHPVALSNATAAGSAERRGSSNTDESTASLRDSMSCLNLSIANSEDNANLGTISAATAMMAAAAATNRNGSPVNTLNEFHFESNLPGIINGSKRLSTGADTLSSDGSYPCLRSFVQNGERVPMPELEIIRIGTATI
ncbi:hypothetical protein GGF38_003791 [Coemansia sp. RSA 25]|nr:hypothetical protein GGF38_003791 [Coemansia sp. RSA 25]